jgi:hypothetical protein
LVTTEAATAAAATGDDHIFFDSMVMTIPLVKLDLMILTSNIEPAYVYVCGL